MTVPRSAYIHIPFCRRRCYYCDFPISVAGDKPPFGNGDRINGSNFKPIAHYVDMLIQEIQQSPHWHTPLETIFLGGGTPSLLSVEQLSRILDTLSAKMGLTSDAEISMEIDPATFDLAQLRGYKLAGVNRVSVGVQAIQPELLKLAGRSHTPDDIFAAIDLVHQVGLTNISLDLISGLPHQTLDHWQESLETAVSFAPTHLSCYDLTVEAGTPFSRQYKPGIHPLPSDELTAEMYRTAQRILTANGFEHYEISNYAKLGYQCRHNRVYWENRPFYGFGMGATSYVNGDRIARPRTRQAYYKWIDKIREKGAEALSSGVPDLLDTIMLGLRLATGLDLSELVATFGETEITRLWQCLQPFIELGWVTIVPAHESQQLPSTGKISLTDPEGFLFSNVVLTAVFEEFDVGEGDLAES